MKLRELFNLIQTIQHKNNLSDVFLCGGVVRDRVMGNLTPETLSDLDLTTGNSDIHYFAKEFCLNIKKKYTVTCKQADDGHISVYLGNIKVDFSSNFIIPNISSILKYNGIKNPTDIQEEMFSRDFTCNSLLLSLDLKNLQDPTHKGLKDIQSKIIRTCLDPSLTLRFNPNRVIRVIYMSAKLDFDVDPKIVNWIAKNKEIMNESTNQYLAKNIDKALSFNPDRTIYLINKMDLWGGIPITKNLYPYFSKNSVATVKSAQMMRNFDYTGPNSGFFSNIEKYKSISDFRKKRLNKRKQKLKRLKNKGV